MADRIAVMSTGASSRSARPRRCTTAPANLFVAQFIGTPAHEHASRARSPPTAAGRRRAAARCRCPAGLRADAGGRHRRSPSASGPSTCTRRRDGPVGVVVRAVEWLGHECLIFGVGRRRHPSSSARSGMSAAPRRAARIRLAVDPADVHLFDAEHHVPDRLMSVTDSHGGAAPTTRRCSSRRKRSRRGTYGAKEVGLALAVPAAVARRLRRLLLPAVRPACVHWGTVREPARRRRPRTTGRARPVPRACSPATTSARACGTASSSCSTPCPPA